MRTVLRHMTLRKLKNQDGLDGWFECELPYFLTDHTKLTGNKAEMLTLTMLGMVNGLKYGQSSS